MIGRVVDIAVMPQQAQVAMVHAHLVNQSFAEEISLIFGQIHIVLLVERVIHHQQRMQGEGSQLVRIGIDPPNGTRGLETESGGIRKTHREIIGETGLDKTRKMACRAAQEMGTMERTDRLFRQVSVITAMHT